MLLRSDGNPAWPATMPQVVAYHLVPYPWLVLGVMLQKITKMSLMNHGRL